MPTEPEHRPAVLVPPETLARIAAAGRVADRNGSFPAEGIQAVQDAGLLQATVARRYGGPGGGMDQLVQIISQLFAPVVAVESVVRATGN